MSQRWLTGNGQHNKEFLKDNQIDSGEEVERHACALDLAEHELPNFDRVPAKNCISQES
jgi:hypothetical protein